MADCRFPPRFAGYVSVEMFKNVLPALRTSVFAACTNIVSASAVCTCVAGRRASRRSAELACSRLWAGCGCEVLSALEVLTCRCRCVRRRGGLDDLPPVPGHRLLLSQDHVGEAIDAGPAVFGAILGGNTHVGGQSYCSACGRSHEIAWRKRQAALRVTSGCNSGYVMATGRSARAAYHLTPLRVWRCL